jgi:hypothetical protein
MGYSRQSVADYLGAMNENASAGEGVLIHRIHGVCDEPRAPSSAQ